MKIALFSKGQPSLELGATKNRLELAKALEQMGWEVKIFGSTELGLSTFEINIKLYAAAFKNFLLANAVNFDVVLYDHDVLPFERNIFAANVLFVSRPALLTAHFDKIQIPLPFKEKMKRMIKKLLYHKPHPAFDYSTLIQADLVQVQNSKDRDLLIAKGLKRDKIYIIPNGIATDRLRTLRRNAYEDVRAQKIMLVCVGTFDYRKGAMDIVWLFKNLNKAYPGIRLKLLGTNGMVKDQQAVLNFFPHLLRNKIEVLPKFSANDLPQLLEDCHIGIFPSYLESFGYGALEMMAAGLPVVSYSIPGPCDFIPIELQVDIGQKHQLLHLLRSLIDNQSYRRQMSASVTAIAQQYSMDRVGALADDLYRSVIKNRVQKMIDRS